MLTRQQKEKLVAGLEDKFRRQQISIFADLRGISVAKLSAFRRELRKIGAELKMGKKTLLKRALETVGINIEPKTLEGELGVIFGYGDQIAPAKAATKFSRGNETFKVVKGVLEGRILETKDILALARLPSREQLLAGAARALNSPIQGLVNALEGNIRNLVVVLNQIRSNK